MRSCVTTAIVPAAGLGSRMRPLTDAVPKELLPLGRSTALQHTVRELVIAGIERIILVTSPAKEAILRAAFATSEEDVRITFAIQTEMRGLGDAVLVAEAQVPEGEPFLVALGDAVIGESDSGGLTRRLIASCSQNADTLGLAVHRVPKERISRYGVVEPVSKTELSSGVFFAIAGIVEKPKPEAAPSDFAVAARYVLPYSIFSVLRETAPDAKGEVQLTDALKTLLASGNPGLAVPLANGETRYDIGGFDSYYKAFALFALSDKEAGETFRQEFMKLLLENKEPVVQ